MELKNSTRHFVSVYDLMYSSAADTSMDAQLKPNWKTIGGKYIAVNTDGHLTLQVNQPWEMCVLSPHFDLNLCFLQEENSTRFLSYYPSKKIENFETFFLCAINGSKSYLVPSRKTSSTRDTPIVWNAEACEKEETFQKKLQTLIQEKLHLYRFGGVSIMETNFDDDNMPVSLSTELKHLCMLKCNSNSAIEISPQ